ncbi:MAG: Peptidoglycan-binding lysin domain protein [Frankiales bacterium]|nr:Peptidoglycan-binding lysin domain protein [Frankiales bacterium]MCW3015062.1 Peptidoglycan-binding lysin domain protein [Solirubrobacterales bacterium]
MQHRSPARFLAPLALITATIAVYVLVQSGSDATPASSTQPVATTTRTPPASKPAGKKLPKTYTVKSGDTLSGIAVKSRVPMAQILELNKVDANSLGVGRELKLRK